MSERIEKNSKDKFEPIVVFRGSHMFYKASIDGSPILDFPYSNKDAARRYAELSYDILGDTK